MNFFGRSKLRKTLLKLYFFHPEKEYYIRQLEKIVDKPAAYVRAELLKLEKEGLLVSHFLGKERFFRLNETYPLYEEIKKIVSKTIGLEALLEKKLSKMALLPNP